MLTKAQIKETLFSNGLMPGDHLLVHSSLRSVGPIDGGPEALIDALREATGSQGTLAMPTFNYRFGLAFPYFDPRRVGSRAGALTEIFRRRPDTIRSLHPTHSVAAQGKRASEITADHYKFGAFGVGCPIDRLVQAGGYVLLLGVSHLANSCIHVGESHADCMKFDWQDGPLPVVKILLPEGTIIDYQLDCTASCSRAFNAVEYWLRRRKMISDLMLGEALCFLMRGKDIVETVVEMIRKEPDVLLCTRPDCRPCTMARRYLLEHGAG